VPTTGAVPNDLFGQELARRVLGLCPARQDKFQRGEFINGDLSERLTAFRRRMAELPAEVAEFLDRLGRIAEAEPQGF
jgi:hypothetical protein